MQVVDDWPQSHLPTTGLMSLLHLILSYPYYLSPFISVLLANHQPDLPGVLDRPAAIRHRHRVGGRHLRRGAGQHRLVLPGAHAGEEPERSERKMNDQKKSPLWVGLLAWT